MAYTDNISRLTRLTAILTKLQAGNNITPTALASQFGVSARTIYRDLSALEQAGVPLVQGEHKGYTLLEGYRLPPIMFTETEANALIFGEKLIQKTKDDSLIKAFGLAIDKIKAVLTTPDKEKADFLASRTIIGKNWQEERTSNHLTEIQQALTHYQVLTVQYQKPKATSPTVRALEPFAIYHNTFENWVLIAWCRLRKEFRSFRVDRIKQLNREEEIFEPHQMTMEEYVQIQKDRHFSNPRDKGLSQSR